MAITGILAIATSALMAGASRVNAVANNIANLQTEGYRSRDVRTVTQLQENASPVFAGGGVRTVVIEEEGATDPVREFAKLIQARNAYGAALQTLRIGEEIARETVRLNT